MSPLTGFQVQLLGAVCECVCRCACECETVRERVNEGVAYTTAAESETHVNVKCTHAVSSKHSHSIRMCDWIYKTLRLYGTPYVNLFISLLHTHTHTVNYSE